MSNQQILCFDFGLRSVGLAVGQTITGTASPLPALKASEGIPNWTQLEKIINDWKPSLLLVGLPLNMDGTEQDITLRSKKFAKRLYGRFGIDVVTFDERLSTADAKQRLFDLGGYKKLDKAKVDSVSACLIFESWCNRKR